MIRLASLSTRLGLWLDELFEGWGAAQTATVLAAALAVVGVVVTIFTTSKRGRREHQRTLYAEALAAIAAYLEGPYRIHRKDGSPAHRNEISSRLSDVKASIDYSKTLLELHGSRGVVLAFEAYESAAKLDAGQQMHDAWNLPPITADRDMNLFRSYDRTRADRYRQQVVEIMAADLRRSLALPWREYSYWRLRRSLELDPTRSAG